MNRETKVINIISKAFAENPSVLSVIKNKSENKTAAIKALAKYAYRTSKRRNGIFFSSDQCATALCYPYFSKKDSIVDYWNQLWLIQNAIGWKKLFYTLKREKYMKSIRPRSSDFLYFWFFASSKKETRGAFELKDLIFERADQLQLPIYLETSVEKNKRVYERYGFEVYHIWKDNKGPVLYFMRRSYKV